MKPVILAEKPPQAKKYAEAFKNFKTKKGYIEVEPNSVFPNGVLITWAIGHLVELQEPKKYKEEWGSWKLESLPINPEKFIYTVSDSKKMQFNIVKDLLHSASEIIIATDGDREGENIARSIINHANANKKQMKRLWANSLEPDTLYVEFQNLRNADDFYLSFVEAQTRQFSDWLVGMNGTILYTSLLKQKGFKDTFSVGRVQTPTLYMINKREQDMRDFKPKPFYEIQANVKHKNGEFILKGTIKEDLKQTVIDLLSDNKIFLNTDYGHFITDVVEEEETEKSPQLYTLSAIQTKANKVFKYSPKKVLEIVQSLYLSKLVTYPRTDTPYITESEYEYLSNNVEGYKKLLGVDFQANLTPDKRYVNSKKVQEHYAIVPTKHVASEKELSDLSPEEKNVYLEIVRNTLAMFHQKYKYMKTVITVQYNDLVFKNTGKVEVLKGWKELYPDANEQSKEVLPSVETNDPITLNVAIKEGKTSKPKRYTEGELVNAMKTCGKELETDEKAVLKETEGIGTEATRADIIETLKKKKYIEVKKNLVYVTPKGEVLSKAVEGSLLASPSMTAKWETFLQKIGKGERQQEAFLNNIRTFINKMISETPEKLNVESIEKIIEESTKEKTLGKCPSCKDGEIVSRTTFYGCNRYKEGCKQSFPHELLKKKITEAQLKRLLEKGKTTVIKGFEGKKLFDAFLTLQINSEKGTYSYKLNFEGGKSK
ncbi:type IA DNA topoisomerase [Terribacillus saccharophilus]|uniref:type IA DNA topoisomerase n=1 Tax=Terribacillus saccharophilus TaxID=361277 RepID=UPI00298A06B6|nr:DNA topoisomerase III [Terribacillus saccharophilus]MCM3227572.1 DNA topoisomerase III [Terribacillus saccharophilus]